MREYCFSVVVYENNIDVFVGYLKSEGANKGDAENNLHMQLRIDYPKAGNIVIKHHW